MPQPFAAPFTFSYISPSGAKKTQKASCLSEIYTLWWDNDVQTAPWIAGRRRSPSIFFPKTNVNLPWEEKQFSLRRKVQHAVCLLLWSPCLHACRAKTNLASWCEGRGACKTRQRTPAPGSSGWANGAFHCVILPTGGEWGRTGGGVWETKPTLCLVASVVSESWPAPPQLPFSAGSPSPLVLSFFESGGQTTQSPVRRFNPQITKPPRRNPVVREQICSS